MITLKGPDKDYTWEPTLLHIAALEEAYGSLYLLGEQVLTQALTLSALAGAVRMLYRQAGCTVEEAALDAFILRRPCAQILVEALLAVLGPVEAPEVDGLDELLKREASA